MIIDFVMKCIGTTPPLRRKRRTDAVTRLHLITKSSLFTIYFLISILYPFIHISIYIFSRAVIEFWTHL